MTLDQKVPRYSLPRRLLFAASLLLLLVLLVFRLGIVEYNRLLVMIVLAGALAVAAVLYLLSPLFSAAERGLARAAYGTHRDVVANAITAVVVGQTIFFPIFLFIATFGEHEAASLVAVVEAVSTAFKEQQAATMFLALLGLDAAFLVVIWLRLLWPGVVSTRQLGLFSMRFGRELLYGFLGWLAIVAASLLIAILLNPIAPREPQVEMTIIARSTKGLFLLFIMAGSLLAPFTEELFFRGYIFQAYQHGKGLAPALFFSAVMFAAPHLNLQTSLTGNFALFVPLAAIGLILAGLLQRTGNLVAPVTAHVLNNGFALVALYTVSQVPY